MKLQHHILGTCEVEVNVDPFSSVDSFLESGFSVSLNRDLTDSELDQLQNMYEAEIQEYSWENGSRNHN